MPGEKSVGSVSVRVVPDTTGFADKVKAELSKIGDLTIKVTPELDDAKLRAQLAALNTKDIKIPAKIDVNQDELGRALAGKKITIPAKVDVNQNELARAVAKLKKVHVPADVDTKKLASLVSSAFAGIKTQHIPTEVDIDRASVERALAPIAEKQKIQVKVQANIDRGLLQAQMEHLKLKADVEADQAAFERSMRAVTAGHAKLDAIKLPVEVDQNRLSRAFSGITSAGASAFRSIGSFGSAAMDGVNESVGELGKSFSAVGEIAGSVLSVAKFAAIGVGIAEAGAAITAAWGLASTAIAAVPAAIGLIGAPIAAVLVGMDGIKAAAKTIEPQFKSLQKTVSAAFEKGLTPVLKQLANELFPKLGVGLSATATALSTVAANTTKWLTSATGIDLLSTSIGNINAAIGQINLVPLVDGFVRLAGNKAALSALTTTINQLGLEIQKIADNPSLDTAFAGLEAVLRSLTTAFGDLVNNGIKLFATAAPGVQTALDGISSFFNKFDWARIGTAVGNALKGVGDAFKNIPPATVEAITRAFENLGNVLNGPNFQNAFQTITDQIPGFITALGQAIDAISDIVLKIDSAGAAIQAAAAGNWKLAGDLISNTFSDVTDRVVRDVNGVPIGIAKAGQQAQTAAQTFHAIPNLIGVPLDDAAERAKAAGLRASAGWSDPTSEFPSITKTNVDPVPGLVTAGLTPAAPAATQAGTAAVQGWATGTSDFPSVTKTNIDPVAGAITSGFDPAENAIALAAERVVGHFGTGLGNISPATLAALGPLGNDVTTGLTPAQQSATDGATAITTAFTTALAPLGTAFTTVTPQINAFGVALTTLNPQLLAFNTSLTTTNPQLLALGTSLTTINPLILAFNTTLTTLNPLILAFNTTLTTLNPQLLALGTNLTTLNPQLLTLNTNLTTVNPQILALNTNLTTINPQLLAFSTAFTTVNSALLAFKAALDAAVLSAAAFGPAVKAAFDAVNLAITGGLTTAATTVTTKFAEMKTSIDTAMTDFNTSVKTGLDTVKTTITTGMDAAVKAINGYAQQFTDAGNNLAKAFIDALGSAANVEAAKAAGAKLGAAGAEGVNSAKGINSGSPSKKGIASGMNLGGSFTIGMDRMVSQVTKSGANLGSAAVDAMNSEFSGGFDAVDSHAFAAAVHTSVGSDGASAGGTTSAPVVGVQNIYADSGSGGKKIADSVNFRLRTVRRGVHADR